MATWTSMWQPVAPALLVAGLIAAPVGLDLQQGLWGGASQAYARGSSAGGPGGGGPGDSRGGGVGGRGGAEQGAASAAGHGGRGGAAESAASATGHGGRGGATESVASAAGHDAREGRGGGGYRESGDFSDRGVFGAVGRAPDREQDGAAAHLTAKASAGPGQEFDTDTAVFVFGEPATHRAGGTTPQVRSDRALAHDRDHEQHLAVARERYNRALGAPAHIAAEANAGPGQEFDTDKAVFVFGEPATEAPPAHITAKASAGPGQEFDTDKAVFVFGEPATEALIRAGWITPQVRSDLADQGQKVTTYVAIATALGQPAYIGVLQAIFGSDGPGRGPAGDWWDVNLDLNGDGIVDEHDLELARQRQVAR